MNGRLGFYRVLAWIARMSLGRYLRVRVEGLHHLPRDRPFILASNHKSTLDPILILAYTMPRLSGRLAPAATKGLFVGPLGWFLRGLGAVEIDRSTNRNLRSVRRMLRELEKRAVLIFPEGGIHVQPGVGDAKVGVGFLARKSRRQVIPMAVIGSDQALPKGGRWIRRPREIVLRIGADQPGSQHGHATAEQLSISVMARIRALYDVASYRQD